MGTDLSRDAVGKKAEWSDLHSLVYGSECFEKVDPFVLCLSKDGRRK